MIDWLLDSDPSIRWQALRDLTDGGRDEVASERARVATQGWGAALLARLAPGGDPRLAAAEHREWVTLETLLLLRSMGLDASSEQARSAVSRVHAEVAWQGLLPQDAEWHGNPFFAGEVEPCINGRAAAVGAYFGQDVAGIVERLLGEQMADGGWNCEDDNGSKVGSFHTTINVLEGLLEYERRTRRADVRSARIRGEEYLLTRRMFRRRSTGEIASPAFLRLSFPCGYHYDILRGLDYLRSADAVPDSRLTDALEIIRDKRDESGRWALDVQHSNHLDFDMQAMEGLPNRWISLHAARVLRWAS